MQAAAKGIHCTTMKMEGFASSGENVYQVLLPHIYSVAAHLFVLTHNCGVQEASQK